MVSGSRLLPGKRALAYVKTLGGTTEASVAGTRIVTTAVNAALANGMFAHADETDDSHRPSITHPGASVVPAALAMAERNRLGGTAFLRAIVLGYDVGTRLTMSLDLLPFYQRGHHPPSFGGLFGAAAAAAALAGLDAERARHALAYTAQQAAGLSSLFRDPEHIEKAFDMGGMPAHNGTQAALLAAHGFTGIADAFSGDRNFYAAFSPGANPDLLVHGLGKTYEVMNTSIKKWPVGGPILGPLDALDTIRKGSPFGAEDVAKLVVRIPDDRAAIVNDRAMPDINLQHMVAVMLLDGTVSFEASHDFRRMRAAHIVKLKKRIELVGIPPAEGTANRWSADRGRWQGEVEVTLRDGRTLRHYSHAARGSNHNPMTREEENAKALDLMAPVLGKKRAEALIVAVWDIEGITNARKLGALCRVA
jgi:2-methylcitrate dehydratase PrpD